MKDQSLPTTYLPDFLVIPCALIKDQRLHQLDQLVYGVIYWFSKLKNEKCTASNQTMGDLLGAHKSSIANSISRLNKCGYVRILYEPQVRGKNLVRQEIIPLIVFLDPSSTGEGGLRPQAKGASPTGEGGASPTGEHNNKSNKKNNKEYNGMATPFIHGEKTDLLPRPEENPKEPIVKNDVPYSKMSYLTAIPEADVQSFMKLYPNLSEEMIRNQALSALRWLQRKQLTRQNYKTWMRDVILKRASTNVGDSTEELVEI